MSKKIDNTLISDWINKFVDYWDKLNEKDYDELLFKIDELLKSQREELEKRLLSYLSVQEKTKNGIIYVPECEIDQILLSNIKEE